MGANKLYLKVGYIKVHFSFPMSDSRIRIFHSFNSQLMKLAACLIKGNAGSVFLERGYLESLNRFLWLTVVVDYHWAALYCYFTVTTAVFSLYRR